MSIQFSVKMNAKYMHDFYLYNTYTKISGILVPVLGVAALGLAVHTCIQDGFIAAMPALLIAVILLVVNPMTTKTRAAMQVQNTPMFQKPLEYELDETGITVRQDDVQATNKWEDIAKVVSTKKSILIYMNRVRAIILPKECMGEQYDAVVEMLRANVPAKSMRMK